MSVIQLASYFRAVNTFRGMKVVTLKNRRRLGLSNSFQLMQELFANLQRGSGAAVITASSGVEYALESQKWKNGVFTYSVLEGLQSKKADTNKDGEVRVSELRDYVVRRVKELTNGQQTPTSRQESIEFDFRVW